MVRKASGTASWHLAPPAQEVTHAIIDVIVDGPIGHQPRAVAEVVRPAAQQTVQPVAYIRPRFLVAGDQQLIDLGFEPLDALPGGARAQVSAPFLAVVLRPKRIAKEVEAFLPSILQRGLRLVEHKPEPGHHLLRPRQSLGRISATEDDEVVGIGDHLRTEHLATSGQPPMLQEAVHVQVRKHRTGDTALRRAARAALASRHAPLAFTTPTRLLDRRLQPHLDQPKHMPIDDAARHRFEKLGVWNAVEVLRQIGIDHIRVAPAQQPVHFLDRVRPTAAGPIAICAVFQVRFKDRLQHQLGGGLNHPVPDRGDAERTFSAARLRDHHPSHRSRAIRLRDQFLSQTRQPCFLARRRNHREALSVHARGSPVACITFPPCRAHYPGGPDGCARRLLPHLCGLPRIAGGSASASSLSRPAQALLTLRPAGLLDRPRRPLSRGFSVTSYPATLLVSYQTYRQLSGWILPPLVIHALRGTQRYPGFTRAPLPDIASLIRATIKLRKSHSVAAQRRSPGTNTPLRRAG